MVVGGQLVLLLYMQAACWLYMFIFLQVQCVVLLLELNTDGGEVWVDFLVSGFVLFLLWRAQLCLFFFLERERGRGTDGEGFFFGPKRILGCEKVGMACADKVDTKRPDLSFLSIHLSPLSCLSPTLYGCSFSGSST